MEETMAIGHRRFIAAIVGILALVATLFIFSLDGIPQATQVSAVVGIVALATFSTAREIAEGIGLNG